MRRFIYISLQFVDDTICFLKAEEEQVLNQKNILLIFETISALKVKIF